MKNTVHGSVARDVLMDKLDAIIESDVVVMTKAEKMAVRKRLSRMSTAELVAKYIRVDTQKDQVYA